MTERSTGDSDHPVEVRLGDLEGATIEHDGDRYRVTEFLTCDDSLPDVAVLERLDGSWNSFKDELEHIVRVHGPIETVEIAAMADRSSNPVYGALKQMHRDGRIERDGDEWSLHTGSDRS